MELENLVTLIQKVSESELTGFQYETDEFTLKIQKEKAAAPLVGSAVVQAEGISQKMENAPAATENAGNNQSGKNGNLVKSPLVGTFYAAPSEEAEPFVAVGDTVKKGQVIAIVEAMKLMNDIESDVDGTVTEVLVKNGEAVEYGQPLFRVE
ncbi:acetyl-CoA carboxylase biotin carboxyl carrier protein [Roseburia hominis]